MFFNRLTIATILAYAVQSSTAASIYGIANTTADFSTLAAAVDAAGLTDTLSGDGSFTVFAPLNSAFEALPEDLLAKLLNPTWQPQLQDVILYHALGSKVDSTMLSENQTATTLNGEDIIINLNPPRVNENSNILVDDGLVDVAADNGLVHGIDTVLTPTSVSNNIVDIALANPDFSTLVEAVTAADLGGALSGEGPLTVFAPTNEAFAAIPADTLANLLLPENKEQLTKILQYHVVAANAHSSSLTSGPVDTLTGDSVALDVSDAGVMVNDAKVVKPNVIASNGIIHVIDKVLMPPDDSSTPADTPTKKPTEDGASVETSAPTKMPTSMPTEASGSFAYGTLTAAAAIATGAAIIA